MPAPSGGEESQFGLKRCLGFAGVLGQSIASIGMTLSVVIVIPLIYGMAGTGMWWAYVVATIAIIFVVVNINQFAREEASSGGLALYVEKVMGPWAGIAAAWALGLAYLITTMCVLGAYVENADVLGHALGFELAPWVRYTGSLAICVVLACWEVKFSTLLMLITEILSITVIIILCVVVLSRNSFTLDASLLTFKGVSFSGICSALVMAVLGFTGFESSTTLGYETRKPLTTIPRVLFLAPIIAGLFFIFAAYVLGLAFHTSGKSIASSAGPIEMLSQQLGLGVLGWWVALGASVCCFGATLASLTASARIFLSLSRRGLMPAFLGKVHPRMGTPQNAVLTIGVIVITSTIVLEIRKCTPMEIFNYAGTVATFGFLLAYLLVAVCASIHRHRKGTLTPLVIANSLIAVALIIFVVFSNIYPVPAPPMNWLPWVFLVLFGGGMLYFRFCRPEPGK